LLFKKVGVEGLTYAGCHGLHVMHPDGQRYQHTIPQDYKDRLAVLEADLKASVATDGAWVEHKNLLVAVHYREVDR
jgi:trehalose-phosphatase